MPGAAGKREVNQPLIPPSWGANLVERENMSVVIAHGICDRKEQPYCFSLLFKINK